MLFSVKVAEYWPRSFRILINFDFVLVHKNAEKNMVILTSRLASNAYLLGELTKFVSYTIAILGQPFNIPGRKGAMQGSAS